MVAYVFQRISREGKAAGVEQGSREARDWYRDRASQVSRVNTTELMNQTDRKRIYTKLNDQDIGRMFMFFYDPKHKKTLPYYDRFPLIFVINRYSDGFLGMNLHYIPLLYRARLMDALYTIQQDDRTRDSKKLQLSYNILNRAAKFRYFQPTVKRYLTNKVASRFIYIPEDEWDIAMALPTERFVKASTRQVHNEARNMLGIKR